MKKIVYLTFLGFSLFGFAQTTTENFIKTTVFKAPGGTQPSSSVTYFDGLGRPIQTIAQGQSASGNDIITHIEYDAFGRQVKDYLPFASTSNTMAFDPSGQANTMSFYTNPTMVQDPTNVPFSEKQFEASPLNRVLKQAAPGFAWRMGGTNEIKLDYQTNTATEVKNFVATATWNSTTQVYETGIAVSTANAGFYEPTQLYKNITYDENANAITVGNTIEEFKDKEGKVVLKRTYNQRQAHDTYYVYDIYGNLTYVLPPLSEGKITQVFLDNLCYQYKYDYRNRLVEKKLPGKQWEFIVYDKLDRVVATGPANAPFPDLIAQGKTSWMITKYDVFSRPVYTGWEVATALVNSAERANKQSNQNNATLFNETKTTNTTIDGIPIAYSNNVVPTNLKLLTINYYDDYNYPNAPTIFNDVAGQPVFYNNTQKPRGMPTGSWVRVLESSTETRGEISHTLYDNKARPIRTYLQNYLGGYTAVETALDFAGKTLATRTGHRRGVGTAETTIDEKFEYTPQDRLKMHWHTINGGENKILAQNEYTELGQLKTKLVGNYAGTANPFQKVDYKYNIRGWLTDINDVKMLEQQDEPNDLFAFKINYDKIQGNANSVQPLFNGNIAETYWRTANDGVIRKYGYVYDDLNRLRNSIYQKPDVGITNAYNESMSYDKNGNIITLNRQGYLDNDNGLTLEIDNLQYTYEKNSNQLTSVTDLSLSLDGFKDGNQNGLDYQYDANGNMTSDYNKAIKLIEYNHLNLPVKIYFSRTKYISYLYNAQGVKLQKTIVDGDFKTTTDYLSGFQYKDGMLQFFPHAEGYVNVENGRIFNYVFNYTDHLGNIRLSYAEKLGTSSLKIIEESNYYPFGLKHENYNAQKYDFKQNALGTFVVLAPTLSNDYKYKFIGREWQDELGLNMYDLRARQYDPAIARFVTVDPLTDEDEQLDKSNYAYAWNDPIKYNDPDGECPWCVGAILGAVVEIGSQAASNYVNGKDVTDISWGQVGVAAVEGALTSGASVGRTLAVKAGAALASSAIDYANDGNKIRSVKDGLNIVKNAAINVAVDKVAGGVSKFALGKIGEKALAKAGDKAILSNNTANKIVKAVTGTSNRTADAIAKKVDVVGGSKVVSKAIKESVSTAGTAAAKAAANKKVEDVKKSTSF